MGGELCHLLRNKLSKLKTLQKEPSPKIITSKRAETHLSDPSISPEPGAVPGMEVVEVQVVMVMVNTCGGAAEAQALCHLSNLHHVHQITQHTQEERQRES